jgi:WD40 repeat protein
VAFSPDGNYLATASGLRGPVNMPGEVTLWEAATGEPVRRFEHPGAVRSVAFSLDRKRLLLAWASDNEVKVWNLKEQHPALTLRGHKGVVYSVAFSPHGEHLASASDDGTAKVWQAATGQEQLCIKGYTDSVLSVAYSPDGRCLATAGRDQTVKVWAPTTNPESHILRGYRPRPTVAWHEIVTFSPDGKYLAWATQKGVKVWEAQSGIRQKPTLPVEGHRYYTTAFSPDGQYLAWARGQEIRLRQRSTGKDVILRGPQSHVFSIAFSPNGRYLASAGDKGEVALWEAPPGKKGPPFTPRWSFQRHTGPVTCVAFSPDSNDLALASEDCTVRIWKAQTGAEVRTLGKHPNYVFSVAYSREGKFLASAGDDETVKLWEVQTNKVYALKGHTRSVWSVAFSPDGKRLASAGRDGTVKLWDVLTRQEILTLKGVANRFSSVAFSPDSKCLAAASANGIVQVWDAHPLTPELLVQREARSVVEFLAAQGWSKDEVSRRIEGDATISNEVRQQADRLAEQLGDNE